MKKMIGNCVYTFAELASTVFPRHMERLRLAIDESNQMEPFRTKGIGPVTILSRFGLLDDFKGCYVLIEKGKPCYVGISRAVIHRLCRHVKRKTHYSANLAYKLASEKQPHDLKRSVAMKNAAFLAEFQKAQHRIGSWDVAFIEIDNDLELYLFEAYCAMELGTLKLNTFRTH